MTWGAAMTRKENLIAGDPDFEDLLHPACAFASPDEVLDDADLTLNEKRAILASWASDACAVESAPTARRAPNGQTVTFDEIISALRKLDVEYAKSRMRLNGRLKRALRLRKGSCNNGGAVGVQ
jgi:hypothetical protein